VAAFDLDADTTHPADFGLLRGGGLALYRAPSVLAEAEHEVADLGYALIRFVAIGWDESALHEAFATGLGFPDYYGRNMNALADCLYDVAHGDYGWTTAATGLAITLDGFGNFADRERDLAVAVVDVLAGATRAGLLFGHRLLWLLQVDDGNFRFGSVGGFQVPWNGQEWLDAKRL
jgi:RNAse (barnase) inhibitor barstar